MSLSPENRLGNDAQSRYVGLSGREGLARDTKATSFKRICADPGIYVMGIEIKLFFWLLIAENGTITGTYDQIGKQLSTNRRNSKNWAQKLKADGIVTIENKSHGQVDVRLAEPYMKVASMIEPLEVETDLPASHDPELDNLITIFNTAKATGQKIQITTAKGIDFGTNTNN